jgi:hypothetical protein
MTIHRAKIVEDRIGGLLAKYYRSDYDAEPNEEYAVITSRKYYEMAFQLFCVFENKFGKGDSYDDHFKHETSAFAAEQAMRAFMDRFMIFVEDLDHQEILDAQAEEMEELKEQ